MEHTKLLRETRGRLEGDGYSVRMEKQNKFWLDGASATVSGQPDLVAEKEDDVTVIDVKTGIPRQSDIAQVMMYMYGLPRYFSAWNGTPVKGRVVYDDHEADIPADAISPEFIEHLRGLIRRVADGKPAAVVPSAAECNFCPITLEDCPQRLSALDEAVAVEDF